MRIDDPRIWLAPHSIKGNAGHLFLIFGANAGDILKQGAYRVTVLFRIFSKVTRITSKQNRKCA